MPPEALWSSKLHADEVQTGKSTYLYFRSKSLQYVHTKCASKLAISYVEDTHPYTKQGSVMFCSNVLVTLACHQDVSDFAKKLLVVSTC